MNYEEKDFLIGILIWRLGGIRLAEIAHRSLGLPGMTTLRTHSKMVPLIASAGKPTVEEITKNLHAVQDGTTAVLEARGGPAIIHQVLMFDEIASEKRVRLEPKTSTFLGVCREHGEKKVSLTFNNEDDLIGLFHAVDDGTVHYASEVRIRNYIRRVFLTPFQF